MYKNCAQTVDNRWNKPVQSFPHRPPSITITRELPKIIHTFPTNTSAVHTARPHVLHSPVDKNNGGEP